MAHRTAPTCSVFTISPSQISSENVGIPFKTHSQRLRYFDLAASILGVSGLLIGLLESELYYQSNRFNDQSRSSTLHNSLRFIVSLTTILLLLSLLFRHFLSPNSRKSTLYIEFLLYGTHWPPGIDWTFSIQQLDGNLTLTGDAVFNLFLLCRIYLLFQLIGSFSKWRSEFAQKTCKEANCDANLTFAFKAMLQTSPFLLISVSVLTVVCICGWSIRTFERPYNQSHPTGMDFDPIWNSFWLTIVSMTTVGYGDLYPRTHPGRIITVFSSIFGIFLISIMVLTLTKMMAFRNGEMRVCDLMGRLTRKVKSAGKIVLKCMRINRFAALEPVNPGFLGKKWRELRVEMRKFRSVRSFELPFADLCTLLNDSLTLWEDDIHEHYTAITEVCEQLLTISDLNTDISLRIHLEITQIQTKLAEISAKSN